MAASRFAAYIIALHIAIEIDDDFDLSGGYGCQLHQVDTRHTEMPITLAALKLFTAYFIYGSILAYSRL